MSADQKKPKTGVCKAPSLTFIQTFVTASLRFASAIVASHILTPEQINAFSVTTGLALPNMLRDSSATEFPIQ